MLNSSRPFARARLMMLSSSGPANIAGNSVSTAILIRPHPRPHPRSQESQDEDENKEDNDPVLLSFHRLTASLLFHNLQSATQALFGATCQQKRSDGIDRRALAANNFA